MHAWNPPLFSNEPRNQWRSSAKFGWATLHPPNDVKLSTLQLQVTLGLAVFFSANFGFALTKIGITSLDQFHLNTFSFPSIARSLCCLCRNLAGAQLSLGTIFFGAVVSIVWVHFNMMFQNFIPKYHVDSLWVSMHVYLYQTCLKRNVSRVMAWYKSRIPTISSLVQVVQVLLMVQKSGEKTSWSWGW